MIFAALSPWGRAVFVLKIPYPRDMMNTDLF